MLMCDHLGWVNRFNIGLISVIQFDCAQEEPILLSLYVGVSIDAT